MSSSEARRPSRSCSSFSRRIVQRKEGASMWENFIGQQIRRCNRNLLIANLVLLGASVTYASMFDYGEDGWWMLGMAVPLPLLATWNLSRWKKRVGDYTCHPICKRLARFGTVEQVIQQIETAILTNPVKKIAGVTLFGPWLFKKSFFGLKCFRIPRMKPAKGSQCRNKVAILGIRLCRPSILIAGLASVALAQSAPTRRDIPTIAKSAKEAMVTIVTGNNDEPIALGSGFPATLLSLSSQTAWSCLSMEYLRSIKFMISPSLRSTARPFKHLRSATQTKFKSVKRSLRLAIHSVWN